MGKFWNWVDEANELRLTGPIASESWFGDEVTPEQFREELGKHPGKITVYINSPGGDVFAASEIYTMLLERRGEITVKIDALAASAASVIAMAGGTVLMAPTAYLMIHDPLTCVMGNKADLKEAIKTLEEIKEGLINAYELKTRMSRDDISALMEKETWMSAYSAMELGFADGIIGEEEKPEEKPAAVASGRLCVWAQADQSKLLMRRIADSAKEPAPEEGAEMERLRAKLLAGAGRGPKQTK